MSHRDIARASGLSVGCVAKLSRKKSWKGVDIDIAERFSVACGVNLLAPWRAHKYLRREGLRTHIRLGHPEQKRFYQRLFEQAGHD